MCSLHGISRMMWESGIGMDDVMEILLALEGKWAIGQHVRTNAKGLRDRDITYNNCGDYFLENRWEGYWYGTIRDLNLSRPDFLLVGHNLGGPGDAFVAWYKPEDVMDGWEWQWTEHSKHSK